MCANYARCASEKFAVAKDFCARLALACRAEAVHIRRMTYAHNIINQFGGVRATAAALSLPPSTVQGWKNRGTIPDGKKPDVLAAAIRTGLSITQADFWPGQR